jgi:uridine kinase
MNKSPNIAAKELVGEVRRRFAERTYTNLVVGISGIDGAGKTTLGEALVQQIKAAGMACILVCGDDFERPEEERYLNRDWPTGHYEDSFDHDTLFQRVLLPARIHQRWQTSIQLRSCPSNGVQTKTLEIDGPGIIVVEGVFLFKASNPPAFDLTIWIDCSFADALKRITERPEDIQRYGTADSARDMYLKRQFPAQRLHLQIDDPKDRADIVL